MGCFRTRAEALDDPSVLTSTLSTKVLSFVKKGAATSRGFAPMVAPVMSRGQSPITRAGDAVAFGRLGAP
jgi:hypothetical protein